MKFEEKKLNFYVKIKSFIIKYYNSVQDFKTWSIGPLWYTYRICEVNLKYL